MPTDDWLIFAYIMLFSSIVFCGILPMIFRLINARQRFHRYDLEREMIEYSSPHQSIYSDLKDIPFARIVSLNSVEQIPYIDEDISNC